LTTKPPKIPHRKKDLLTPEIIPVFASLPVTKDLGLNKKIKN
jgi:hypothetical protein